MSHQKNVFKFQTVSATATSPVLNSDNWKQSHGALLTDHAAIDEHLSVSSSSDMGYRTQNTHEEDEKVSHRIQPRDEQNHRRRSVQLVIGGYPASNGGLDSGNLDRRLLVDRATPSLCSSTTFLRGCRLCGFGKCFNDVVWWSTSSSQPEAGRTKMELSGL